eukprot:jgi/Psemu1/295132/fgenesh1_pm.47_\
MAIKSEEEVTNDEILSLVAEHGIENNNDAIKKEMHTVKKETHDVKKETHDVKKEESFDDKESKVCKKSSRGKGGRKKEENKKKILVYMAQVHKTMSSDEMGRECIAKKEVAEACGYGSPGSHGFFYAYKELVDEGMISGEKLTDLGLQSVPEESYPFQKPKTNEDKQESFYKLLRKKCKEGTNEKTKIIFDVLSDGKPHTLKEFTIATGYANLKSKGLGYNLTCMEKDMKIVTRIESNKWQFTDKCFPNGRPN